MSRISVCYTNFGPYHRARLRALAHALAERGDELLAIEVADQERRYPWSRSQDDEPYRRVTLFSGRPMEKIPGEECARSMIELLDREQPDGLGIVGYSRPESTAALRWARRNGRPTVLMSESQEIDHPRTWWKEAIKRNRVRKFSAGLVGGPRHRDYLVKLGIPASRIAFGNNAVDNRAFARQAEAARRDPSSRAGLPSVPYFLAVNRFVPEKNLPFLIRAFARYRADAPRGMAWDLVLAGDGPGAAEVERAIAESGLAHAIHRPGFLQSEELAPWLAHASAFVHPSLMEPWGLVVNEAAACGLPLIVSDRAGCVETLVPRTTNTSGCRFDPFDEFELTANLAWMAGLPDDERHRLGRTAAAIVGEWGTGAVRSRNSRSVSPGYSHPGSPSPVRTNRSPIMSGTASIQARGLSTSSVPITGTLHSCNGLDPRRDGGMVPSILGMTGALARRGTPITIVTPTESRLAGTTLPAGVRLLGPEIDLETSIRSAEVVHFHGLWQRHTRRGAREARLANVPYLMAAHGHAEPWALRHKALKKKIYTALIEGKNLRRASCLHALSRPEIGHLRALAPRTPVALIPNGVDLAPFDNLPSRSVLEAEFPELAGKFVLLFFGRLNVKKGLDLLAQALASVKDDHRELHLLLAGNDDGSLAPFLAQAEAYGVTSRITVVGHVSGERARQVWAAADAFVLPSYSEGFSMAILEALACRLPSLITTACHFPELASVEGGIVVDPTVESVTSGLRDLLDRSADQRATLAANGRRLVESRYTWDQQARRLSAVYAWVTGGGPIPEAVADAKVF